MGDSEVVNRSLTRDENEEVYSPISIIVIAFNEEKNIRDCLDSLMRVDYPEDTFEVLVIDASTDSTPEIVAGYKKVKLLKSEKGFSQQKNKGIIHASFDIVAFTDTDCIIPKRWLKVINSAFQVPRIAAVGGNAFPPSGTGPFGTWVASVGHPAGGSIGFDANVTRRKGGVEFVAGCNSAYRKKALLDVGMFDPRFFDGGEDVDLSRRLKKKGYFIDYIPELTVYHKPRESLLGFIKWNFGVGVTKFNLKRPKLWQIILDPRFPFWSIVLLASLLYFSVKIPLLFPASLLAFWLAFLLVLTIWTRPFPLLLKRRKRIGVSLGAVLTVIPFLVYLRQAGISCGQLKKWIIEKKKSFLSLS